MIGRALIVAITMALAVSMSSADITIEWVEVDNSLALTGYKTFDLFATNDFGWCCNALLFPLDTGSFYQHPLGSTSEPHPLIISSFPALEFDTYLGAGGDLVRTVGFAGDVGGDVLQFDEIELDIAWAAQTIPIPLPTGRLHMARLTFSDDATGSWRLAIAAGEPSGLAEFTGTVEDIVPEPTAGALLAFGGLTLLMKRGRSPRPVA